MNTMELPQQWICDACSRIITLEDSQQAVVIARLDKNSRFHDFRIVHKSMGDTSCDNNLTHDASWELSGLSSGDGLSELLALLSIGPIRAARYPDSERASVEGHLDDYTDLVRRLFIPNYENSRRKFKSYEVWENYNSANEFMPYTQKELQKISEMN